MRRERDPVQLCVRGVAFLAVTVLGVAMALVLLPAFAYVAFVGIGVRSLRGAKARVEDASQPAPRPVPIT